VFNASEKAGDDDRVNQVAVSNTRELDPKANSMDGYFPVKIFTIVFIQCSTHHYC